MPSVHRVFFFLRISVGNTVGAAPFPSTVPRWHHSPGTPETGHEGHENVQCTDTPELDVSAWYVCMYVCMYVSMYVCMYVGR